MGNVPHARYQTRLFSSARDKTMMRIALTSPVAVMPAADVPAFFFIYPRFASWSGIYWLSPQRLSCFTPL